MRLDASLQYRNIEVDWKSGGPSAKSQIRKRLGFMDWFRPGRPMHRYVAPMICSITLLRPISAASASLRRLFRSPRTVTQFGAGHET